MTSSPSAASAITVSTSAEPAFTPSRNARGCVRVQEVFDLAELVIADPQRWPNAKPLEAADSGRTRTIALARPLPVLIAYWTAGVDPEGQAFFYEDLYNRDAAELKALNGSFSFHPRAVSTAATARSEPRAPQ